MASVFVGREQLQRRGGGEASGCVLSRETRTAPGSGNNSVCFGAGIFIALISYLLRIFMTLISVAFSIFM